MKIRAQLQINPTADRRWSRRRKLSLGSSLQATGDDVTIHDLSPTGMLIETAALLATFDVLELQIPEAGITQGWVIWNSGRYYGCEFKERISHAAISAALLRSPPAAAAEMEMPLPLPDPQVLPAVATFDEPQAENIVDEDKAPFGVRLRVIFGSAIFLWVLIIWVTAHLYKLIRGSLQSFAL
jgi:hypothetical protein